ncbi:MAG: glycerophosphodiester phosphodiesterase family protein [Acidobacteria bacterium]|nr:glycerophosphodiester phosphodiesterase family protein [Acidobacteriota bacterium]
MRRSLLASPRIEVHGHRGARWLFPEHSIPGFEHAIRAGADFIELDVVVTADDVPIAWHDAILTRRKCAGPERRAVVRELTLAQLKEYTFGGKLNRRFSEQCSMPGLRISTLDEVLRLAPLGKFQFNIEIKSFPGRRRLAPPPKEHAQLVVDAIRSRKLQGRVRVQSFDRKALAAVREIAPELPVAVLHTGMPRRFSTIAHRSETDIVGPYFRLVTRRRVAEAHAAGVRVIPWTPNHPSHWRRLVHAGVDGIITDNPAGLIEAMTEWGLRPTPE